MNEAQDCLQRKRVLIIRNEYWIRRILKNDARCEYDDDDDEDVVASLIEPTKDSDHFSCCNAFSFMLSSCTAQYYKLCDSSS